MTCDPSNFSKDFDYIFDQALEEASVKDSDFEQELKDKKNCLFSYLRDYVDFASAEKATDEQIDKLYKKTMELFNGAIATRTAQEENVKMQLRDLEDMVYDGLDESESRRLDWFLDVPADSSSVYERLNLLFKEYPNLGYYRDQIEKMINCKETLKSFPKDRRNLSLAKAKYCDEKTDRFDKFMCIERFVNLAHSRGPYLSTGCGFPMPEEIVEYIRDEFQIEDLGLPATELVKAVLDCLRNTNPPGWTKGI